MRALRVGLLLVCAASSACGLAAQSALGWRTNDSTTERRTTPVQLRANREAEVFRQADDGTTTRLGATPHVDQVEYETIETTRSPQVAGVLIGGALEVVAAAGAFAIGRGSERCFGPDDCFTTSEVSAPWMLTAALFAYLGVQDLVVAWVHGTADDEVTVAAKDAPLVTYVAKAGSFTTAPKAVDITGPSPNVRFELAASAAKDDLQLELASRVPPPPPPKRLETSEWILAVMAVRDRNENNATLETGLLVNVESQLRVFLGQRNYRTIDIGTQRAAIEAEIDAAKRRSYEQCYDEKCQIELGKALAASHIVRAEVGRFGAVCTLNAELVDLATEVSIAAASARGDCRDESFLTMSESITDQLRAR